MVIDKWLTNLRTVIVIHVHEDVFDHAHGALMLVPLS